MGVMNERGYEYNVFEGERTVTLKSVVLSWGSNTRGASKRVVPSESTIVEVAGPTKSPLVSDAGGAATRGSTPGLARPKATAITRTRTGKHH